MGHTVIGIFRHSGDADMAAAHLREEYTLEAGELDIIGQSEWDNLTMPAPDGVGTGYAVSPVVNMGLGGAGLGDEDPIGKRWGDKVVQGQTLVVARAFDPDIAVAIARELRETGADRVDLVPH